MSTIAPSPLTEVPIEQSIAHIKGLDISSFALWLTRQKPHPRVIITANAQDAQWLHSSLIAWGHSKQAIHIPDYETLAFDRYAPSRESISSRMAALYRIATSHEPLTIIVTLKTWITRTYLPSFLFNKACIINQGDNINQQQLLKQFAAAGYQRVQHICENGEIAVKGSIIDLFPNGSNIAFRIDFFDQEIDGLFQLDLKSNTTTKRVENITILPAQEFDLNDLTSDQLDTLSGLLHNHQLEKLSNKNPFEGIHNWLPYLHQQLGTIQDYIPNNACLFQLGHLDQAYVAQKEMIHHRHQQAQLPIAIEQLYTLKSSTQESLKQATLVHLSAFKSDSAIQSFHYWNKTSTREIIQSSLLKVLNDHKVLVFVPSAEKHIRLNHWLEDFHQPWPLIASSDFIHGSIPFGCAVGHIKTSFIIKKQKIIVLRLDDLMSHAHSAPTTRSAQHDPLALNDLKADQMVVHQDHGVGIYTHTECIKSQEFLVIQYAKGQKLFLAMHEIHKLSPYRGSKEHSKIDQLGKQEWKKKCAKAKADIDRFASELINQYAKRSIITHNAYHISERYETFAQDFVYQETPDQLQAIQDIINDMTSQKPMNRLICGDVGFGKTEVAMRAAFLAYDQKKQVILMAPTTILASQHYDKFMDRFSGWPAQIALLTRMNSAKETEHLLDAFCQHKVDILITTHKILYHLQTMPQLDLFIIDEEHRFGVAQKEYLNKHFIHAHQLMMSATPIPRTLNQSLSSVKDLSMITTAPTKRQATLNVFTEESDETMQEAIQRELNRGGQIFILQNDIDKLNGTKDWLQTLVPSLKVLIAHGQLPKKELSQRMQAFYQQEFDCLLATTIIESGIDIPSANTMIILNADRFGMAQLHQLRGRVGRAYRQAYCYFMVTDKDNLSNDARSRLSALMKHQDLGSGFELAMHDLEIRGSGNILGSEQSGHANQIGFQLYMQYLNASIQQHRSGKKQTLQQDICLKGLPTPSIPFDYIRQPNDRIYYYQKLAQAIRLDDLDRIQQEWITLYGTVPETAKELIDRQQLILFCQALGIFGITVSQHLAQFYLNEPNTIDTHQLMNLIQQHVIKPTPNGFSWSCPPKPSIQKLCHFLTQFSEIKDMISCQIL
ncbi:MAG: transcription-repair coupling factor [Candidatus Comchoanobacterales bacterium]